MFLELINGFKVRPLLTGFKAHAGYPSSVQKERRLLSCRVYMVVILELCQGKKSNPVILPLVNKETKVLF
jgi:hypothetical protein